MDFAQIDGVISDMDGVLWRGDQPLPGINAFFVKLRTRGIPFALATNNSSKSQADYVDKLAHMGIFGVTEHEILTSGTTTVDYLRSHYPVNTPVHVVGGDGLKRMIESAGFPLADQADIVVVGIDFQFTYDKLKRAALLIRGGATFIGTNDDASLPMPEGLVPGAGSLLAALRTATGREPQVMGKPNAPMFEAALRLLGTSPSRTLMIGDRLNTDIEGAHRLALRTALVLTGVSSRADADSAAVMPDAIYTGLPQLLDEWNEST